MTMTFLDDYRAAQADKPSLGNICWYSVHEGVVPHAQLKAQFDAYGLGRYAPSLSSEADQFRKVTTAAKTDITLPDGRVAKVMIRPVKGDKEKILRRVVVETVDAAGETLDYEEVWDLEFRQQTRQFIVSPLSWDRNPVADPLIPAIQQGYADAVLHGHVNAEGIRSAMKSVIDDHNGILIRPTGGVYFMPRQDLATLDALEQLAAGLERVSLMSVPMPDDQAKRDTVVEGLTDTTVTRADKLSEKLAKMLAPEGEITERTLASVNTSYKGLRKQLGEYEELLGHTIGAVGVRLDMLDQQMQAAMLKMTIRGAAA